MRTSVNVTIDKNGVIQVAAPGPQGTRGAVQGTRTPKYFGAIGNGTTNDQAAFVSAFESMRNGDYRTLELEALTYLVDGALLPPPGACVVGRGPSASVFKTTSDQMVLKLLFCEDSFFSSFSFQGNSTGANQNGIESGYLGNDGANRVLVTNVHAYNMGGRGFSFAFGPQPGPGTIPPGPRVIGCLAENCAQQGYGAYMQCCIVGSTAHLCGEGLHVGGGNVIWTGGDLTSNTIGVRLVGGGNDGHGVISSCNINHCSSYGIDAGSLTNGFTFADVHTYQSPVRFTSNTGIITYDGGDLDPSAYIFDGSLVRFLGTMFPFGYANTITNLNNPTTQYVNCVKKDGSAYNG